jgi:hypothetical protein
MRGKSVCRHNKERREYVHSVHRTEENLNHIMKENVKLFMDTATEFRNGI